VTVGLAFGKFDPPHRGHALLIDAALGHCDRVIVYVFQSERESEPVERRASWLREIHPAADVRVLANVPEFDRSTPQTVARSAELIAGMVRDALAGECIDVVFTSEAYGEVFAGALGARHYSVDRDRQFVACTGTMIRRAPHRSLEWLEPVVRAHYIPRICVAGAESTGKTSLCARLAERYATLWVAEYGRAYTLDRVRNVGLGSWENDEFFHIAFEQQRREDDAARHANPVLICDTDAFTTSIWYEFYLAGEPRRWPLPPSHIALYLLPFPDVPFVADEIREGEHRRFWMHERFVTALTERDAPFVVLEGSYDDRFAQAVSAIDALLDTERSGL
jgi:HTH-type transcriptional regulator, transcriptional repressor of NAD biosynthesis genes